MDKNTSTWKRISAEFEIKGAYNITGVWKEDVEVLTEVATGPGVVVILTAIFFAVGAIGILGNLLVIFAVVCSQKMRKSMTNLLITNLAFADLLIMVLGIPEIIQFMMNKGWTFHDVTCRVNRYVLVTSLYGSVLTLMSLCVERYIAIIHPIKAHILCNRRRIVFVLGCIWPFAWISGLPTLFYNTVRHTSPTLPNSKLKFCMIHFPDRPDLYYTFFKFIESAIYYFVPLVVQVTLYTFISRHLFLSSDRLHRPVTVRDSNGMSLGRCSEAIQTRKGVVKMLIASVIVYFLSYSPNQILLILNLVQPKSFSENWSFLVFSMIAGYTNSAANPILYSIFSQNFRQCFREILCRRCCRKKQERRPLRTGSAPSACNAARHWRHTSLLSAVTDL